MTRRIEIRARVLTIRKLAKWLGQDFDIVTTQDIERLINQLERSDYSAWTKHDYKVAIKRFYKWLNGGNEYPEAVKWITRARTTPRITHVG